MLVKRFLLAVSFLQVLLPIANLVYTPVNNTQLFQQPFPYFLTLAAGPKSLQEVHL